MRASDGNTARPAFAFAAGSRIDCFQAHRELVACARATSRHLRPIAPNEAAELWELSTSLRIAAFRALTEADPRALLRALGDCEQADDGLRTATFRALRRGLLSTAGYDQIVAASRVAANLRSRELLLYVANC